MCAPESGANDNRSRVSFNSSPLHKGPQPVTYTPKFSLVAVALFLVGTTAVQAQSASITATAVVQTPLTVTGAASLDFQSVFPGVIKSIAPTAATAGRFSVTGQGAAQVILTFTLPATLVHSTLPANTLPIGTYLGGQFATNTQASQTAITVTAPVTTNLTAGSLFVWLGATVTPAVAQVAGTYNGTVTMAVVYTGL